MPAPCQACGAPGYRDLCGEGYCTTHYSELVMTFDASSFPSQGRGMPGRTPNPDDLTCTSCAATWEGVIGELCAWCARWHELAAMWQVDDVLTPPSVDVEDATYGQRMAGWVKRLRAHVDNGIVTDLRARAAIAAAAKQAEAELAHRDALRSGRRAS